MEIGGHLALSPHVVALPWREVVPVARALGAWGSGLCSLTGSTGLCSPAGLSPGHNSCPCATNLIQELRRT